MDGRGEVEKQPVRIASGPHTPLLYLLLPMMAGFRLGAAFPEHIPYGPMLTLAVGLCALAALTSFSLVPWQSLRLWGAAFALSAVCTSWIYYSIRVIPPPDLTHQANREAFIDIRVEREFGMPSNAERIAGLGIIVTPPDYRTDFRGQMISFNCWTDPETAEVGRGAIIRVRGKLEPIPPTTAGFDAYLRQQGCYLKLNQANLRETIDRGPSIFRWCEAVNERWQGILQVGANEPRTHQYANIATAMLLGEKSALGVEQKDRFIASGTMHLFAVSGLHVGIVAGLLAVILCGLHLPQKIRPFVGLVLLMGYVQITGAAPSAIRAWWMAFFFWNTRAFLRQPAPLSALVGSALVVLIMDPPELWSAGFQLSYTVVAGLLLFGVPLQDWLRRRFEPYQWIPPDSLKWHQQWVRHGLNALWGLLAISLTASAFSAPLTVRYFGVVAPGSFLLNIPLVLLAPLAMTASLLSVIAGSAGWLPGSAFFNHASWLFIAGMDQLVRLFLDAPLSSLAVDWRWTGTGSWLAMAMLGAALGFADYRISPKWRFGVPVLLLLLGLVFGTNIRQHSPL